MSASPTPEPVPTVEEPVYAAGPEGDIDRIADEKGWAVDEMYASASEFVQDICESLPVSAVDGASRPQWLAESGQLDGSGADVLKAGVPKLCPKWTKTVSEAVSGDYERWFLSGGTYLVSSKPPTAEQLEENPSTATIPPGTYRSKGAMEDCYWERSQLDGEIVANRFATAAQSIEVTVRAGELFTSEGCGTWKPSQ